MSELLTVSQPPHIRSKSTVRLIMLDVVIALLPVLVAAVYYFGIRALMVTAVSVVSAVISELLCSLILRKPVSATDGSAVVSGMLLAFCLPASVPLWLPAAGSFFMIAIVKMCFGGLGQNIFNPALAGRAFVSASWPALVSAGFVKPLARLSPFGAVDAVSAATVDAVSAATPLSIAKGLTEGVFPSYGALFFGNIAGCIGEVCKLAIIVGALYLFFRKIISWHSPVSFIATVGVLSYIFGGDGWFTGDWLAQILSGGLFLGAFFMASDYATTPVTKKGCVVFGIGCGALTVFIRKLGGYPEGVAYAILLMNAATPLIDKIVRPRRFGKKIFRRA